MTEREYDELYELGMADRGRISIFPIFQVNVPMPRDTAVPLRDGQATKFTPDTSHASE